MGAAPNRVALVPSLTGVWETPEFNASLLADVDPKPYTMYEMYDFWDLGNQYIASAKEVSSRLGGGQG